MWLADKIIHMHADDCIEVGPELNDIFPSKSTELQSNSVSVGVPRIQTLALV